MKRMVLFLILCSIAIGAVAAQSLKGKTLYVSAKNTALKSSTWFFASTRGTVQYGDQVKVLQEKGSWIEVEVVNNRSLSGWMSSANATTKRIAASGSSTSASADELALAGKGFNQEVEAAYKDAESLDYGTIDWMESQSVGQEDLFKFLEEGRLATGGES